MRVRQTTPKIRQIAGIKFLPGINYVDDESWDAIKKHPVGKDWIKKGFLSEMPDAKAEESKQNEPTARELVDDMPDLYDMDKLKELAEDSRKTVAEAAQKQIDKINAAAKEDNE